MIGLEELGGWSGRSDGQFVVDCVGVKTAPGLIPGLKATQAGDVEIGIPPPGREYLEYTACALAASVRPHEGGFRVLEIGSAWGVWCVRAAAIARRIGVPVRTTGIEAFATQCEHMAFHLRTNDLDPSCHEILHAVVAPEPGVGWFRYRDQRDLEAGLVPGEWARERFALPDGPVADKQPRACGDGTVAVQRPVRALSEVVGDKANFDFVHLRLGPGTAALLESDVFSLHRIGMLVLPEIEPLEVSEIDRRMSERGLRPVLAADAGDIVGAGELSAGLERAQRVFVGERISFEAADEIAARFGSLHG